VSKTSSKTRIKHIKVPLPTNFISRKHIKNALNNQPTCFEDVFYTFDVESPIRKRVENMSQKHVYNHITSPDPSHRDSNPKTSSKTHRKITSETRFLDVIPSLVASILKTSQTCKKRVENTFTYDRKKSEVRNYDGTQEKSYHFLRGFLSQ
jgi:hypothetical protein